MPDVWSDLVGQEHVVSTLQDAVAGARESLAGAGEGAGSGAIRQSSMTHAWLFTGPPGSGRSNVARAFAAALQCPDGGCGHCASCTTAWAGSHPDITVLRTEGLSIGTDVARDYVRKAALSPAQGAWQVLVVEDADRLTDQAANALLKAVEEPAQRTVWMLCAPAVEDVIITIRSRCRPVLLRTPSAQAVARLLVERDGIDAGLARAAAAASQGHVGRARALATRPEVQQRRRDILAIPARLRGLGDCLAAADTVHESAKAHAEMVATELDARETSDLRASWGVEDRGRRPQGFAGAASSLEKDQKRRRTRLVRDAIDGVLLDLLAFHRDVLTLQLAPGAELVNADVADDVRTVADLGTPESTLTAIDAILACREALDANAAPLLALEHMMIGLAPHLRRTP